MLALASARRAALAAALLLTACGSAAPSSTPTGPLPRATTGPVEVLAVVEASHVQGSITYARLPPAGGNHAPVWLNCGVYDAPVPVEMAVHSQEHGAVWITYHPNLAPNEVETLRQLGRSQSYLIVSPFPDQPAPVIASAWGRQQRFASAGDTALREFVRMFRAGPQTPEPGAPCTGGAGQPR